MPPPQTPVAQSEMRQLLSIQAFVLQQEGCVQWAVVFGESATELG